MRQLVTRLDIERLIERLHTEHIKTGNELHAECARALTEVMRFVYPDDMLTVDINTNIARRCGIEVRLTASQAVILHRLAATPGKPVTTQELHKALYGARSRKSDSGVRVFLFRLRAAIIPLNARILHDYKEGYSLVLMDMSPPS